MRLARARLALLAAVALAAAACARTSATPGVSDSEVVFGMTTPLSGPAGAYAAISMGARAWAAHVNSDGGIHGRRIRIEVRDDAYVPGRAVANVSELQDSVLAFIGMVGTACLQATRDVLAEAGVPNVSISGNPRVFEKQPPERRRLVFAAYPDYVSDGAFLARQAAAQAGAKALAVFYQNDDFGKDALVGVRKALAELPQLRLVAEVPYEVQERELSLHALKLKESGADAVILYGVVSPSVTVLKEMAKVGYRPKVFACFPLGVHRTMFRVAGELWEGVYFSTWLPQVGEPSVDRVVELLLKHEPGLRGREDLGAVGAFYLMVALEGVRRAGRELTREAYVAALESIHDWDPEGLGASVSFGPGRHHGRNSLRLLRAGKAADLSFQEIVPFQDFPPVF